MKKCKKQKIKRLYKKSIWPSIALFLFFIISCAAMPVMFAGIFKEYLLDSQIAAIEDDAQKAGDFLTSRMEKEGESILEAAAFLERYLGRGNELCITDDSGRILRQTGETVPDLKQMEKVTLFEEYLSALNLDITRADSSDAFAMSSWEFLARCMETLPKSYDKDRKWLNNVIFKGYYWAEIPVGAKGIHLYYRSDVVLIQKHIYFMSVALVAEAVLLTVPSILLFANVVSSIGMQKRMVNLLYLDAATGDNNWTYFQQRCKKILGRFRNASSTYAMMNLHMYRYGDYCACHGSRQGEALLEKISSYLRVNMECGETFARSEKADFGILLRYDGIKLLEKRLKKLLAELTGMQNDKGIAFCAGLYLIEARTGKIRHEVRRRRQLDIDQMYHYAEAARGTVGERKGEHIKFFDQQILEQQLWKLKVEEQMDDALFNREFQLYLQAKYDPVTEKIAGAEALVRWISPKEGMISPNRFIPIFEENGFITKLDDYMISAVAKLQSEWKIQGKKQVPVSVNVSRANFTRTDLAQHICRLADSYGADHDLIELELTESAFFGDKNILQQILKELKMYGFCIAMDDFGTGYSSLNSLKDLPIDVLKLDTDFFRGGDTNGRGEIVVTETIRLAKKLNMKIVAEGIEKKEQVEFLAAQGCDMIQGYYFAKPVPVGEFEKMLQQEA